MFNYSTFFCDDAMMMHECFSCGCYNNNSEIGTLKCFFFKVFFSFTCEKN